ncbi:MAG: 30S ribosomal protein S5 [Candidatus Omnitrophota bacterium]
MKDSKSEKKPFKKTDGRGSNYPERKEEASVEKVLSINRTTKVTKGGKNLCFAALVVVGDGQSSAGFALGKANEVADSIKKALGKARKVLIMINKKGTTIPHEVIGKFGAVKILLKPAIEGTGVIACSPVRSICECAGIKDLLTKNLKNSTNQVNVVKAVFQGLKSLKTRRVHRDSAECEPAPVESKD